MRKALWVVFIVLICFGIETSFRSLIIEDASYIVYQVSLIGSTLTLVYFIPFLYGVHILIGKLKSNWKYFIISFISGTFIATSICMILNELLDEGWKMILPIEIVNDWADALTGPLSEETVKALLCILIIKLFDIKKMKDYMVTGVGMGIGFQILEDITYIFPQEVSDQALNNIIPSALERISVFISSHWVYTAIILVGIYLVGKTGHKLKGMTYMILAFFMHFLWNSPLELYTPILSAVTMIVFAIALKEVMENTKLEILEAELVEQAEKSPVS